MTEEAKQEISDMGEDIDDFVVKTKSKTDQIIRDYTAVASNMYKGVSVLDANGNLRDTYDILLDISKVYREIQEEDKKAGTNRALALVEELAGKNRSNIASSILLNGDVLEQVRNASANDYAGSADQELGKYLDSIDGRIQKLQNHIQELAAININSDWLKTMISLADSAVQIVSKITESVGGLNIAIGAVIGTLTSLSGHGKQKLARQSHKCQLIRNRRNIMPLRYSINTVAFGCPLTRISEESLFAAYSDPPTTRRGQEIDNGIWNIG